MIPLGADSVQNNNGVRIPCFSDKRIVNQLIFLLQDMVAFSCCVFDGGEKEKKELDVARERGWRGKFTRPGRVIRPGAIRMNGKCPLTPLEVYSSV